MQEHTFESAVKILENSNLTNRERLKIIYEWIVLGLLPQDVFYELLAYGWRVDVSG